MFSQKPKQPITAISDNGLNLIKQFEGLRLKPYLDAVGVPTIGYGNTFYENGQKVSINDAPITEQRATELLRLVVAKFEKGVSGCLKVEVTQNQFDALVSFAYNVGLGNLQKSTLLRLINQGNFKAAAEQFTRWNRAGGRILNGLTRRREAEKALFLKG